MASQETTIHLRGIQTGMTTAQRKIAHRRRMRVLADLQKVEAGEIIAADVKKKYRVSSKTLTVWMRKLKEGPEKIIEKPRSGRISKLGTKQYDQLRELYNLGAKAAGFETDLWDGERFVQAIKKAFHVEYSVNTANRYIVVFDPKREKCIKYPRGPAPKSKSTAVVVTL